MQQSKGAVGCSRVRLSRLGLVQVFTCNGQHHPSSKSSTTQYQQYSYHVPSCNHPGSWTLHTAIPECLQVGINAHPCIGAGQCGVGSPQQLLHDRLPRLSFACVVGVWGMREYDCTHNRAHTTVHTTAHTTVHTTIHITYWFEPYPSPLHTGDGWRACEAVECDGANRWVRWPPSQRRKAGLHPANMRPNGRRQALQQRLQEAQRCFRGKQDVGRWPVATVVLQAAECE